MNDRLRFAVLTLLMVVFWPMTLFGASVMWLLGALPEMVHDYTQFYQRTFGKKQHLQKGRVW